MVRGPRSLVIALALCLLAPVALAGKYKVLVLNGDARNQEAAVVVATKSVAPHTFEFEEVKIEGGKFDGNMRGAQIVWFPWNGPGHDGAYFMGGSEEKFKQWVNDGGVVWISAFDDAYTDPNGKQVGSWMPIDKHPIVVQNTADSDVDITADGNKSGLFAKPNKVDMNAIVLDDNFASLDKSWVILATRKDNSQPAACYLPWGKGVYVEACIDTRDAGKMAPATPLIANGLLFLANWLESSLAVSPAGKAATTWGTLRAE
ncbi:hypothetical protein FJZ36_02610 [Candidatus Poribacteria bacterium]|nr:hypothetical protein [Candidatus Poribacteria bacterium]